MKRWTTQQIIAARQKLIRPSPGEHPLEVLFEQEPADSVGLVANVLTIMLRGSECSFRCLMCDLWKFTHLEPTLAGAIPAQIRRGLEVQVPDLGGGGEVESNRAIDRRPAWIKLYNASNFFAARNVPTEDLPTIAKLVGHFDRVIVENHPRFVDQRVPEFASQLQGRLEVAMGLEIADDDYLSWLNKQATVDDFRRGIEWLGKHSVDTRLFVLLKLPGMSEQQAIESCLHSVEQGCSWGVRHISIIPMRNSEGVMRQLTELGDFEPPLASSLEFVLSQCAGRTSTIVTADLWDWHRLIGHCPTCQQRRQARLEQINLRQTDIPLTTNPTCSCLTSA